MNNPANSLCATCPAAHNGINGRYCHRLSRYVEHDKEPKCNK